MISPILIWNIRGIGNAKSMRSLKNHVRMNKVQMICVIEPKISVSKLDSIRLRLKFDNAYANQNDNAKIWLFWQHSISIVVLQKHSQFITVQMQIGGVDCIATFVYASCQVEGRRELYDELIQFGGLVANPWMLGGDFNAFLALGEK